MEKQNTVQPDSLSLNFKETYEGKRAVITIYSTLSAQVVLCVFQYLSH